MLRLVAILTVSLPFLYPEASYAHAFGQQYSLPLPIWVFLYGGAGTVALSFILIGWLVSEKRSSINKHPTNLSKLTVVKVVTNQTARWITRIIGLVFFITVILDGLIGDTQRSNHIAPTLFWIILLLGLTYLTALVGNIWTTLNPWNTAVTIWESLSNRKINGLIHYPKQLGYWPALIAYYILIWLELLSGGQSAVPFNLSKILLIYTFLTIDGVVIFGRDWFRYGEFFSVFFGLVGKVSPLTMEKGQLIWRIPFSGLLTGSVESVGQLVFILFMLSSTAFDGFRGTTAWFRLDQLISPFYQSFGETGYQLVQSVLLLLAPLLFLAIYLMFVWLMKVITRRHETVLVLAKLFGFTLVPIAVVYNLAHYFTLLISQSQALSYLISDPFGLGWNLFGTTKIVPGLWLIRADVTWYLQVLFIVGGHIIAVYLAHLVALRLFKRPRDATISQLPMLALMVVYTMTGLWILSQPLGS